jgi:hypothetical protein
LFLFCFLLCFVLLLFIANIHYSLNRREGRISPNRALDITLISYFHHRLFVCFCFTFYPRLEALPTETASELDVLGHDCDTASVNRAETRVGEQVDHVCFGGLLDGEDSCGLEAESILAVDGDLTDEALEREFAEEHLCALLELADLTESHCAGAEAERALDTAAGSLGPSLLCSLLAARLLALGAHTLASDLGTCGGLAGGVLRANHYDCCFCGLFENGLGVCVNQ